jgi:hypothetical protein
MIPAPLRRAYRVLLTCFGEAEVALPVPARMQQLQPGFVADGSAWRGWRIRRDGAQLSIHRSYPWWESLLRGGEVNRAGSPVQLLRAMIYGGLAFEYRLQAQLVPMPGGLELRGRLRARGLKRAVFLAGFVLAGLVWPAMALVSFALALFQAHRRAWHDADALADAVSDALAPLAFAFGFTAVMVGILLTLTFLMRRHGEANRAGLLAFLARLVEEAADAGPRGP